MVNPMQMNFNFDIILPTPKNTFPHPILTPLEYFPAS